MNNKYNRSNYGIYFANQGKLVQYLSIRGAIKMLTNPQPAAGITMNEI